MSANIPMTSTTAAELTVRDGSRRIIADRLTKHFGATVAVSDLSFSARPGTITALVGPDRAGKTTTLRMILGLITPTAGSAHIDGVSFAQLDWPGRIVGAVLDAQGCPPRRSARRHLLVYCAAMGVSDERADEVLELVGLTAVGTQAAGGYALGARQRLALALALLGDPQILVLDEPNTGLDPAGARWLGDFLREFARSGRTVLLSASTLRPVQQVADTLVLLRGGRSVFQGTVAQLRGGRVPRLLVASEDAAALAHALVPRWTHDVVWRPDGRLAVGGASAVVIRETAHAARVTVYGIQEEQDDLEQTVVTLTDWPGSTPAPWGPS